MKIENWFLIYWIDKKYIKKTLLYLKHILNIQLFTWNKELYEIEIKLLRFFILIIFYNYNNFWTNKNEIILNNIEVYRKNYKKLIYLVEKYKFWHDMFMLLDYSYWFKNIFYDFLYNLYIYHIKNFNIKSEIKWSFYIKNNLFNLYIYKKGSFWHDSSNSLFFEILEDDIKMFWFSMFFWDNTIFIWNLQYTRDYYLKYNSMKKFRLHKYAFYFLKELSLKFKKYEILSYSNENHCNRHSKTFSPIYNPLYEVIGMKKNLQLFYFWNINNLDIRDRDNSMFTAIINEALTSIYIIS